MTNEEICKSFREAKNKKLQPGILADLEGKKTEQILAILEEGGEDISCVPYKKKQEPAPLPEAVQTALCEKMELISKKIRELEKEYQEIADFIKSGGSRST